jgi:hypothetical protein
MLTSGLRRGFWRQEVLVEQPLLGGKPEISPVAGSVPQATARPDAARTDLRFSGDFRNTAPLCGHFLARRIPSADYFFGAVIGWIRPRQPRRRASPIAAPPQLGPLEVH